MAMRRPEWKDQLTHRGAEGLALVRAARAAQRLLDANPAEIQAEADRRAGDVFRAARTAEPYRTLWAGLDEVRSTRDLAELPVVDRSELQSVPLEERLTVPREGLAERSTSGTTGEPLITVRSDDESRMLDALTWRQFRAQGIPPEAKRLEMDLERRRQRAKLEVSGNVLNLWVPETPNTIARIIRSEGVEVLRGTPTCLVEVAEELGPTQMKGVNTAGEARLASDAELLQRAFGVPPMDTFGSNEVGPVSWECPSGSGYHVNADTVFLEVLDEDGRPAPPGEPGDVIVTALWNRTAPIVRYRLADIASLQEGPCPCGITLPLMGTPEGRSMDWVVAPSGRRVSPFRVMLVTLLGEDAGPAVRRYRVIQRATDDFLLEIAWANGRRQDVVDRIQPAYSWLLGAPVHVECVDVPEIPLGPSGKFRQVTSLVNAAARSRV